MSEPTKIFWVLLRYGRKWHPAYIDSRGKMVIGNGNTCYTPDDVAETRYVYPGTEVAK